MPDSPNQPKNEMSMEVRLLIAFVLMFAVLFGTQYFFKPPAGPKNAATPPNPAQAAQVTKPPAPAAPADVAASSAAAPGAVQDSAEHEFTVDTSLYTIRFSNRGAVVKSWLLKKYLDHNGKPLELVNASSFTNVVPPFALWMKDEQAASHLNYALFKGTPTTDGKGIDYEYSDGKIDAKKTFRFAQDSYLSQVTSDVQQGGAAVPNSLEWRGGFGDSTVVNRPTERHSVYYDVSAGKLNNKDAKAAKDGALTASGNFSFAGLDDRFFAVVFLPKDSGTTEIRTFKDDVAFPTTKGKNEMAVGAAVGGDAVNRFSLFVGPKDIDILRKVDPKLPQLIDWGTFGIIAKPLFLVMHWINDNMVHNYGWAIVVLTILINLALFPLRLTSLKSQKKMQALQPHIRAINDKYKGLKLNDPRKAEQNEEVMGLYKQHGVNPMGGCLPMIIQLPILWAFYKVLSVTIELRGAHFLWVTDLSQPESLAIHVLPIVMVLTQFITQQMTPTPGMDPAQANMMKFMPLMFGFFFYNMSSGLVLYWLTGNLVGIVQQVLINRIVPPPAIEPPKVPVKKKSKG